MVIMIMFRPERFVTGNDNSVEKSKPLYHLPLTNEHIYVNLFKIMQIKAYIVVKYCKVLKCSVTLMLDVEGHMKQN